MNALDPKSCPFCGTDEHLSIDSIGSLMPGMPSRPYRVTCRHIDHDVVSGPVAYGRIEAVAAWNRRFEAAPSGQATLEGVDRKEHARRWLSKRWGIEHPNEGHVKQLAEYAAALLPASAEPVAKPLASKEWFERKAALEGDSDPTTGIGPYSAEDIAHMERLQFEALPKWAQNRIRELEAASPPASGAVEAGPEGLSEWEGWDRSRGDWSETKHKDAVLAELFGAWSMEDAATLIGFIDRTWTKRPASPREGR